MLYIIACQAKIKSEIFLEHLKPNWIWWFRNTWSLNMTEFLKLALCNFCRTGHQHQMFQLWRILPIDWLNKRYRQQNLLQKSIDNRKIYRHWIFSTKFVTILSPSRHCNWLINLSWDAIYFPWRSCLRENNINSNSEKKVGRQILWTRSLGALRAPTSRLRPFGPALGPSGLLDNVLHALRALRPCDQRNSAMMG